MKYVIVIPDGCADEQQDSLDGKTPLEAAATPNMDACAAQGIVGSANHTPKHLPAGSAVANMSLLGYDPGENFTGRAPLEAAAQEIELSNNDWAIRCNLVTVEDHVMSSFTAGHISSDEAKELLMAAQDNLEDQRLQFVPGVSYRNLLLYRGLADETSPFSNDTRTTPPHDLTGESIENEFPRGPGSSLLANIMSDSVDWFAGHQVNNARVENGKLPATNLWLWGIGKQPRLKRFQDIHGLNGAMITAVDLLRGLAAIIGWDRIEVPGATGYTDTDYAAKGQFAIEALSKYDVVCVHVEAPDESSHEGDLGKKIESLERIDKDIVGPIRKHFESLPESRMLITPDHPTFISTKTHTHGDVPFVISGTGIQADSFEYYHEKNAARSAQRYDQGYKLMSDFVSPNGFGA